MNLNSNDDVFIKKTRTSNYFNVNIKRIKQFFISLVVYIKLIDVIFLQERKGITVFCSSKLDPPPKKKD